MDAKLRLALINKVKKLNVPKYSMKLPVVSIEDFFEGNDDRSSIGCNLMDDHPGVDRFYEIFKTIKAKDEVYDVLVAIYEIDESDDLYWPYSEHVIIITTEPESVIWTWVEELHVTSIEETKRKYRIPKPHIPRGYKLQQLWWD